MESRGSVRSLALEKARNSLRNTLRQFGCPFRPFNTRRTTRGAILMTFQQQTLSQGLSGPSNTVPLAVVSMNGQEIKTPSNTLCPFGRARIFGKCRMIKLTWMVWRLLCNVKCLHGYLKRNEMAIGGLLCQPYVIKKSRRFRYLSVNKKDWLIYCRENLAKSCKISPSRILPCISLNTLPRVPDI